MKAHRSLSLVSTLLLLSVLLAPSSRSELTSAPSLDFFAGNYRIVGVDPDFQRPFQGTCSIRVLGKTLLMTRRIQGRKVEAVGRLETAVDGIPVLRARFSQDGIRYEITYLIDTDLDNYARLSGNFYRRPGGSDRPRGLESLFHFAPSEEALEASKEDLARSGKRAAAVKPLFAEIERQMNERPNAELEFFRKHLSDQWKEKRFLEQYMLRARDQKSYRELEALALLALNAGMVDAGFSTLDVLYVTERLRPSNQALRRIPGEFNRPDKRAARTGWHGVWLLRGTSPVTDNNTRLGLEKLRYAARQGHSHSKKWCEVMGIGF